MYSASGSVFPRTLAASHVAMPLTMCLGEYDIPRGYEKAFVGLYYIVVDTLNAL